jgi:hypothetical protein
MHPHLPTATHRQTSPPSDTDYCQYWVTESETEKWKLKTNDNIGFFYCILLYLYYTFSLSLYLVECVTILYMKHYEHPSVMSSELWTLLSVPRYRVVSPRILFAPWVVSPLFPFAPNPVRPLSRFPIGHRLLSVDSTEWLKSESNEKWGSFYLHFVYPAPAKNKW